MKTKLKLVSMLLCASMAASMFAACADKPSDSSKPDSSAASSVEDTSQTESSVEESSQTESSVNESSQADSSVDESSQADSSAADSAPETSEADTSKEESSSAEPFVYDYSKGLVENGFFDGVNAAELVTLPDFTKLDIPYTVHTASEEELAKEVANVLSNFSKVNKITDREIKNLDNVNIDYVGSVDGVEFVGGNTKGVGTTVQIGVTSYIDDFLEQLIGHKPGETINVEVTFPESYPQSVELQGKDAVFVTTINYIEETVVPELTDDFVKENLSEAYGWSTTEDLKTFLSKSIIDNKMDAFISNYLLSSCTVASVPEIVKTYQEDAMMKYYNDYAQQYGMTLDDFFEKVMRINRQEIVIENAETLLRLERQDLINQAIAETAGLEITEEDLKAFFLENMHTEDYSSFEENWGLPYLKKLLLGYAVTDHISSQANHLPQE